MKQSLVEMPREWRELVKEKKFWRTFIAPGKCCVVSPDHDPGGACSRSCVTALRRDGSRDMDDGDESGKMKCTGKDTSQKQTSGEGKGERVADGMAL